jgi:hypothetical protein
VTVALRDAAAGASSASAHTVGWSEQEYAARDAVFAALGVRVFRRNRAASR